MRDNRMREGEQGAALLTVLMLVAVIAVMAGAALEKLRLSTRLAGNAAATEQARGYARAAETLALGRIGDLIGDARQVTLAGGWSNQPFGLPLPGGGFAVARVTDGGNCFNLNGLVAESEQGRGVYASYTPARLQFARLMRLLAIPGQVAERVAASTADWIDTDQNVQDQGAEDGDYLAQETPYRTAGTLMADPSELRAVAGVTPAVYATLRPWICTLPVAAPARINVNTLTPEQAPLLAMLFPDTLPVGTARALLLQRPAQGYKAVSEFWKGAALQGITFAEAEGQTDVTTQWFALAVDVTLGGADLQQRSLIDATRLPARLVARQWGETS